MLRNSSTSPTVVPPNDHGSGARHEEASRERNAEARQLGSRSPADLLRSGATEANVHGAEMRGALPLEQQSASPRARQLRANVSGGSVSQTPSLLADSADAAPLRLPAGGRELQSAIPTLTGRFKAPTLPVAADQVDVLRPELPVAAEGQAECRWEAWTVDSALGPTVCRNLAKALEVAEARTVVRDSVFPPVRWEVPQRSQLLDHLALQAWELLTRGAIRTAALYILVTGVKGAGKTSAMLGAMQGLHLSLAETETDRASGSCARRLLQGYLHAPLFAIPADPENPFCTPPRISHAPTERCLPMPAHLMAIEVLRAHGFTQLPGARGLTPPDGSVPPGLCWHEDAYTEHGVRAFSNWLGANGLHLLTYIDEVQTLFTTGVDVRFAARWCQQLAVTSVGDWRLRHAYCFSGSSTLLPRIFGSKGPIEEAAESGLGAVPDERGNFHEHRIRFVHVHAPTTEASFRWLLKYGAWPIICADSPSSEELALLYEASVGERFSLRTPVGAKSSRPRSAFLQGLTSEFSTTHLGPIYKALAAMLARQPHHLTARFFAEGSVFDTAEGGLALPIDELRRSLQMLADYGVDASAQAALDDWELSSSKARRASWRDRGFLVGDDRQLGFPSTLLLLEGIRHLTAGACSLHHDVVRTVFKPEGTSATTYGEAIVAAGLCERRLGGHSNLAHLAQLHLIHNGELSSENLDLVKRAIDATPWKWTLDGDPLAGLGVAFSELIGLRAGEQAQRGVLYKPKPDNCGLDLIGLSYSISGISVLIGVQVKLSAGRSDKRLPDSECHAIAQSAAPFITSSGLDLKGRFGVDSTKERVTRVLLVVTNRQKAATDGGQAAQTLIPDGGAAAVLAREDMASSWPSPVRVLAHDFALCAYGPPIPDDELRQLRHSRLSLSENVARILMPGAATLRELSQGHDRQAQRAAEASLTQRLAAVALERHAGPLAKQGVTVQAMESGSPEMLSTLRECAQAAGLNKVDVQLFMQECRKNVAATGSHSAGTKRVHPSARESILHAPSKKAAAGAPSKRPRASQRR